MKAKNQPKKSKNIQKGGAIVMYSAFFASLLKVGAGLVVTHFLVRAAETGGWINFYIPTIVAHVLAFAVIDVIFFLILRIQNIKYGIKTYVALAIIPVVFLGSWFISQLFTDSLDRFNFEPMGIWFVMSLGCALFTAGIGQLIKLLPRKV